MRDEIHVNPVSSVCGLRGMQLTYLYLLKINICKTLPKTPSLLIKSFQLETQKPHTTDGAWWGMVGGSKGHRCETRAISCLSVARDTACRCGFACEEGENEDHWLGDNHYRQQGLSAASVRSCHSLPRGTLLSESSLVRSLIPAFVISGNGPTGRWSISAIIEFCILTCSDRYWAGRCRPPRHLAVFAGSVHDSLPHSQTHTCNSKTTN